MQSGSLEYAGIVGVYGGGSFRDTGAETLRCARGVVDGDPAGSVGVETDLRVGMCNLNIGTVAASRLLLLRAASFDR